LLQGIYTPQQLRTYTNHRLESSLKFRGGEGAVLREGYRGEDVSKSLATPAPALASKLTRCTQLILFTKWVRLDGACDIDPRWTLVSIRRGLFLIACTSHRFLVAPDMADKSQRQEERDGVPSSLDVAIDALNRAKEAMSVAPDNAAFSSASVLLTTIGVGLLPVHVYRLLANVYRTRWPTKRTMSNWD